MKPLLIRSLALSLGLLATGVRAQEIAWRSVPAGSPTASASQGQPIAIAVSRPAGQQPGQTTLPTPTGQPTQVAGTVKAVEGVHASPAASLGRPIVIATTVPATPNVQPVSFTRTTDANQPIIRGAAPDSVSRPLPDGPASVPSMTQNNWRRADEPVSTRLGQPEVDAAVAPPPGVGMPILPTPAPTGPSSVTPGVPSSLFATNPDCASGGAGCCAPGSGAGQRIIGGRVIAGGCAGGVVGGGVGRAGPVVGDPGSTWGRYVSPMFGGLFSDGPASDGPAWVLNAEALLWWMKGDFTPPLATQVSRVGGALTQTTLIGGRNLGDQATVGGRFSAQYWFSDDHCWGVELGGFYLGPNQQHFSAGGSPTDPFVGRLALLPDGTQSFEQVSGLGTLQGTVSVDRKSTLWGYEANAVRNLINNDCHYMNFLIGFRALGLDESLNINENLFTMAPTMRFGTTVNPGTQFLVHDQFSTSNRFYGGQIGLAGRFNFGDFFLGYSGKVALGVTEQIVNINGSTTVNTATGSTTAAGGFLTQSGRGLNIGHYSHKSFGVVPELGATLGYNITDWWSVTLGYNFLYWNNVVRPGDQVNLNVNPANIPNSSFPSSGVNQPAFQNHQTSFYASGVTLGMQFRF